MLYVLMVRDILNEKGGLLAGQCQDSITPSAGGMSLTSVGELRSSCCKHSQKINKWMKPLDVVNVLPFV